MILALHTLGMFMETALGIWIFSKAFPKREVMTWKQTVSEAVIYTFVLLVLFVNFLQTLPMIWKTAVYAMVVCSLLALRYFGKTKNKVNSSGIMAINTLIGYIELIVIACIITWNYWNSYISAIMVITANLFLPFFLYCYFQCNWFQAFVWELMYLATIQIVKVTYMSYLCYIQNKELAYFLNRMNTLPGVLLELCICFGIFFVVRYFSAYDMLKMALVKMKKRFLVLVLMEVSLFTIYTELGYEGYNEISVSLIFSITMIVILTVLIIIISTFKNTLEMEKGFLDVRNKAVEQQYFELRRSYERNRCIVHDTKHLIQYIEECILNNNSEAALRFLSQYKINMQEIAHHPWVGIPTIDFLINTKKQKMDTLFIEFRLKIELDEIPIEDADLVILLGNLMDNAIEATSKCSKSNREISLRMRRVNDIFMIGMQNTSVELPVKKKERFLTSKKEAEGHGWGIESIKHIVNKYKGEIDFTYNITMFQVKIIINLENAI